MMENLTGVPTPDPGFFYSPASSRTLSGEEDDPGFCMGGESIDFGSDSFVFENPVGSDEGLRNDVGGQINVEGEETQPKRRGRKGHTKSRRGCYNCKRARIKCKENQPTCDYCSHRDLICEWPDLQLINQMNSTKPDSRVGPPIRNTTQLPQISPPVFQSEVPVFTMHDFRLFNHFIQAAYPHHPIGNDSIWTHDIPSLASEHAFLLHSMLALSAQDLADTTPPCRELQQTALSYRVKAITALNEAVANPNTTIEQSNAMLATCFVLVFQSVLMEDGLIEYMSFFRGIIAVAIHMGMNKLKFLFSNLLDQTATIQGHMRNLQLINPDLARAACRSLEQLAPLITNPKEVEYYGYLLSAARDLFTSSSDAYGHLSKIYGLFSYFMGHEEFSLFVDPNNEAGKLLLSHFAAMQLIMTPITAVEEDLAKANRPPMTAGAGVIARWLTHLHKKIHPDYRKFYEWPLTIEEAKKEDRLPMRFT